MPVFAPKTGSAVVTTPLGLTQAPWEGGYCPCTADGEAEVGRGKGTNQKSWGESMTGGRLDSSLQHLTLLWTHYMLASVRLFIWGFIYPITKPHIITLILSVDMNACPFGNPSEYTQGRGTVRTWAG